MATDYRSIVLENTFFKSIDNIARMGITFQTDSKKYFYDSGTGKVLECSDQEYTVLEFLLLHQETEFEWQWTERELWESLESIEKTCRQEHLLEMPVYEKFTFGGEEFTFSKDQIQVTQLILELTQQCNLRCGYCIYNDHNQMFRNFESKDMEWSTARAAIDYAYAHSKGKVYITFYGGEPLLKYDLLKQCIDYAKRQADEREITVYFSFTTNLTLVTKERARYFASVENLGILTSLDGPKEIHDQYRKHADGLGSFDNAIQGLKYLVEAYGEKAKIRLSVNGVLTPPYIKERLESIKDFYIKQKWMNGLQVRLEYVDLGDLTFDELRERKLLSDSEKFDELQHTNDPLAAWCIDNICTGNDGSFEFNLQKQRLLPIHKRYIGDEPMPVLKRNGCCIPGSRRLYVNVDGYFYACERVGETPNIGNIKTDMDFNAIKKYYIDDYDKASIKSCNNCWACHLCQICYVGCISSTGIDIDKKKSICRSQKIIIQEGLKEYFEIYENRPDFLTELDDIQMI